MPFPWSDIDRPYRAEMLEYYKKLGEIRRIESALDGGSFYVLCHNAHALVFVRENDDSRLIVSVCRKRDLDFDLPAGVIYADLISGQRFEGKVKVRADQAMILKEMKRDI